jgi:cellulose synthase/poly-beta-1,6-N-acetylglucosamine synthase-like glycosyltransferase
MPTRYVFLAFGIAIAATTYFLIVAITQPKRIKPGDLKPWQRFTTLSTLFLVLPFIFGAFLFYYKVLSLELIVLMMGLTFTFFYNFLTIPLAVWHKSQESKVVSQPDSYPPVSIIVPAYNEEKCLERTIETLIEIDYPDKEIIVVDDGSTDRTYEIAQSYRDQGVNVFHRPNGGKAAALNYGLLFARREIIVTVDADSLIGRTAIKEVVKGFHDPEVGAVCGNIKVLNRNNLLTQCQALEYIISINLVRRAFDIFGTVTVVPGALGAFRRETLADGGFYDWDTLVEDFDVTVKTLKAKKIIQASSDALAYTEAPQTLGDLIKQRLRWYRGNYQTILKHRDIFLNPRFDFLYKLAAPFMWFSMIFIPFAGIAVIISVVTVIWARNWGELLYAFSLFVSLQFLLSVLTIQLDDEDMRLLLYSPFFVVGYKHLMDWIMIKSLFDILLKRKVTWTRAKRIGTSPKDKD